MSILNPFQSEDLSRLAIPDGALLSWQPGLGKTRGAYTWAFLKCGFTQQPDGSIVPNAPVLFVVPGDLHPQYIEEGQKIFRTTVTALDSQATLAKLLTRSLTTHHSSLPNGFYITSYYQLGANGITKFPELPPVFTSPAAIEEAMTALNLRPDHIPLDYLAQRSTFLQRYGRCELHHLGLRSPTASDARDSAPAEFRLLSRDDRAEYTQMFLRRKHSEFKAGLLEAKEYKPTAPAIDQSSAGPSGTRVPSGAAGSPVVPTGSVPTDHSQTHNSPTHNFHVKCLSSPSLADLLRNTAGELFTAVAVDEGTKMKSDFALIATGVRTLNPRYRLICTATPIKNRVPDIFHLLSWAVHGPHGAASARLPFAHNEKQTFAETFCVSEQTLSRQGTPVSSRTKLTPQVCNVHRLWKTIAPSLLRRRKSDIGTALPEKRNHIIRVPMGTEQRIAYKAHLDHYNPKDRNGRLATGAILTGLRQAAAFPPTAPLAGRLIPGGPTGEVPGSSDTPAIHTVLQLILKFVRAGQQFMLFAPFIDPLDHLSHRLNQAGISHLVLDGRSTPKKRAKLAAQFKGGPRPSGLMGALCSIESMAEGHNFPLARNAILYSYPWALDKVLQAIDRIHRLDTPYPVDIYRLITQGTIDRRLESQIDEKSDSSELILDGHLLGEQEQEVNLRELLNFAYEEFNAAGDEAHTLPEETLRSQWPELCLQLQAAAQHWPTPTLTVPGVSDSALTHPLTNSLLTNSPSVASPARTWRERYLSRTRSLVAA